MTPHEEHWLALRLVEGLGAKTMARLLEHYQTIEAIGEATATDLTRNCGVRPDLAERIAAAREHPSLDAEKALLHRHGAVLLPQDHSAYPARLLEIGLAPTVLYCRAAAFDQGESALPSGPVLAVVGTRVSSRYGEKTTRLLIEGLARLRPDTVILSGLARGIDTIAHDQALACGLATIAVLGTGLARIYPPENADLAERIVAQGALISEFPMSEGPRARNFPIRNRILSAMADAVFVVEAGDRSGALITAGFALTHGRPVLALPGNVDLPGSLGTNRLIRSGEAALVQSAEDLARALLPSPAPRPTQLDWFTPQNPADPIPPQPTPAPPSPRAPSALQGDKGRIIAALRAGPLHPDDLSGETGVSIGKLVGLLLELELSGDIVQTAENHYALA